MGCINLSFITNKEKLNDGKIILEKEYSKNFKLIDDSIISISSTTGLIKDNQQDSIAISINENYILLLLADGIGGLHNGEIASYYTTKIIKDFFEYEDKENLENLDEQILTEVLYTIVYEINRNIPYDSGSTLSFALICPEKTFIINIGDSRIYTTKNNEINLESYDDSLAFDIYQPKNTKERERLRFYKKNNQITNFIMKGNIPKIRVKKIDNINYDILCLLTDGVSDILTENQIRDCLYQKDSAYLLTELSKHNNYEYLFLKIKISFKN